MKKKVIILIICLLILIIGYLGYKGFLLFNYRVELNKDIVEKLKVSENIIKITTNPNIDNSKKQNFEDISYKKIDDNFILKEDETYNVLIYPYYSYYLLDGDSNNYTALFKVGRTYNAYETLTSPDVTTFGFSFKGTNRKKLLDKFNLKDDFDIYKYIIEHYNDKINIFSSRDKIRINYLIKSYVNAVVPASSVSIIDGDIKGYMYNISDLVYEVHLIGDKKNYSFGFWNNQSNPYFNQDNVIEFISNVHLK